MTPRLDWIIIGGESGPGARPFDVAWARSAIEQCKAAGVPVFVKQMGSNPFSSCERDGFHWGFDRLSDRNGGDIAEWPRDLRVREFPKPQPIAPPEPDTERYPLDRGD